MTDLFTVHAALLEFKEKNQLSPGQSAFILKILEGTDQWSPLDVLARTTDFDQLKHLKNALKIEIDKISKVTGKGKYLSLLEGIFNSVQSILGRKIAFKHYCNRRDPIDRWFENNINTLYQQTINTYHGTIMMPITLHLDPRGGTNRIHELGYLIKWATRILKNERPFGLHVNQQQTLQPVSPHSALAVKYPEINHFAVLTKEITQYKNNLRTDPEIRISDEVVIDSKKQLAKQFFTSISDMAQSLVTIAENHPAEVCQVTIHGDLKLHTLGFCVIDNRYHFFDTNSGWYRFDNKQDFINWLPFYDKQMRYQLQAFKEYEVHSYVLKDKPLKEDSWTPGMIVAGVILGIIFSPIVLLVVIGVVLVSLVPLIIDRAKYHFISKKENDEIEAVLPQIKKYLISNDPSDLPKELPDYLSSPEKTKPYKGASMVPESLPRSLDILDLAVDRKPKNDSAHPLIKNLDYLDLSVNEHSRKKNAFPIPPKNELHTFFKKPRVVKPDEAALENKSTFVVI